MSALTRNPSTDTIPNEIILKYYVQRAAGGVGLIVSEGTLITRQGSLAAIFNGTALQYTYNPRLRSKIWQYDRRHIESHLKSLQAGDDWRDHAFRQSGWFEMLGLYWPTVYDESAA
ncbi:hypothetical protein C8R44DRAFT_728332 [Mycena epipterygia]|nr:hypothetical protein C8R44DRAFT_728332 [Mycena epipterygia]